MQIINFYQKIEELLSTRARLIILYYYAKTQTFHIKKKKDNIKFHIKGYLQKMFINNY